MRRTENRDGQEMKWQDIIRNFSPGHSNAHFEVWIAEVTHWHISCHQERPIAWHQVRNHLKAEGAGDAWKVRNVSLRNTTNIPGNAKYILVLLNRSRDLTKIKADTENWHGVVKLQQILNSDNVERHELGAIFGNNVLWYKCVHANITKWSTFSILVIVVVHCGQNELLCDHLNTGPVDQSHVLAPNLRISHIRVHETCALLSKTSFANPW